MEPEKIKQISFRVREAEHQALKILAAREKKTIQEIILLALDKTFPGWRSDSGSGK